MLRTEHVLQRFASPTVGRRAWSSYRFFGAIGWLAGFALVVGLGARGWTLVVLGVVPLSSFSLTIALGRAGWWRRRTVLLEKFAIALLSTGLALHLLGEPVRRGIELAILGLGAFATFGRIGCFRVACCHGRRARRGVRYSWEHAIDGFPERWVGVPLFPIQLVDGLASAVATVAGSVVYLRGGDALAVFVCAYGVPRFFMEVVRGDEIRASLRGISEAQVSIILAAAIMPAWWSKVVACVLLATLLGLAPWMRLTSARHVAEVAATVDRLIAGAAPVTTSEGVELSLSRLEHGRFALLLGGVRLRAARVLARQLGRDWNIVDVAPAPGGARALLTRA